MPTALIHAESSVRLFGGVLEDYYAIHDWYDISKQFISTHVHRSLRHHTQGILECVNEFGPYITVMRNGRLVRVSVKAIGEQHIIEDCGALLTPSDWMEQIQYQPWMSKGVSVKTYKQIVLEQRK